MRRLDTTLLAMTLSNVGMFFIENDKQNECDRHPGIEYSFIDNSVEILHC